MGKIVSARSGLYGVSVCVVLAGGLALRNTSQATTAASNSDHPITDPRQAMVAALAASRPHPSLGNEARAFDRLVGVWDCDFSFRLADGRVRHKKGELLFGWVMDGRAIQDLWIGYPTGDQKERTIGTTIRFFDSALKQWRVVFVNPQFNYVVTTQGGLEGERIVLRGLDSDGLPIRWTFSEMKPESFHWQGEKSRDGGKTWMVEEDHHMKRRS